RDEPACPIARIGQRAIGVSLWPIGQDHGTHDHPLELAPADDTFLHVLVVIDAPQQQMKRRTIKKPAVAAAVARADTTTPHGRLMVTVLGGLAEFERSLILARTSDGRKRAMAKGVKFGRPPSLTPHQRREAIQRIADGEGQAELARSYGVSQATISRLKAPGPFAAGAVDAPQ